MATRKPGKSRKAASTSAAPMAAAPANSGDTAEEIAKLRQSVDALEQGLTQLLEATGTHTELLRALLAAATAPTEPEQDLVILLKAVVARLADQSVLLRALGDMMNQLPEDVGASVGAQMASALAAIP